MFSFAYFFCSFAVSLGQALIMGMLQFGEKNAHKLLEGNFREMTPVPQKPELETSIVVLIFLYFTSSGPHFHHLFHL